MSNSSSKPKVLSIINGSYIHSSRWIDTYYENGWDQIVFLPEFKYIGNKIPKEKLIYSNFTDTKNFILRNKFVRYVLWAIELKKIIKKYKPDVIHAQVEEYGIIPYLAKTEVPILFSLMGAGLYIGVHTYKLKRILFDKSAKYSNYITLDTYRMQDKLYSMVDKKDLPMVERVMWGVKLNNWFKNPQNLQDGNIPKDRFVILSIRNFIDENYNISKIIDSIPFVIEKIPNAFFVFIGRDDFKDLENYAKSKGYEEYFYFKGLVLEQEFVNTVYSSDVVISIPTWDSVATSVLESLYLEKPVVVGKNVPDLYEWIEDKKEGVFIQNRDGKSVADAIVEIHENYSFYKENLHNWKIQNSDAIDYDKNFERIEEIIVELAKNKKS